MFSKYIYITLIIFSSVLSVNAQPGEWVWLHGSSVGGSPANFGFQGVSSPSNVPPSLYEANEWMDQSGNLWLFGGLAMGWGEYGDVWKYDPLINEWVWMKGSGTVGDPGNYGTIGVPSPANNPPARAWGSASWTDNQGKFWMYGGMTGGTVFSDLWRYDPLTNEWTWVKGPSGGGNAAVYGTQGVSDPANHPGSRFECASAWTDNSGNLWLFGGYIAGGGYNDLWRYNIAANEWTWMKGSQFAGPPGVYGIQGVEDPANTPAGRQAYCHWKDATGNLWLFGGYDYGSAILYNDLWRYNPSTNNWTWMMGDTATTGTYGTKCTADSTNIPGGRVENRAGVTDQNGNFWLFGGGQGTTFQKVYNDLWFYCVSTNEWTWVSGDDFENPAGVWGTQGVSSPLNKPNGRGGAIAWHDQNGHIYVFGGTDDAWLNPHNDLWKFTIDPSCTACSTVPQAIFSAPNSICPGTCTQFTNLSVNATSYLWDFPGANPSASTDVSPANICYNAPGTYSVTLIATNSTTSDTLTLNNYITVYPYPPPQGISQSGDTLFAIPGAVSYQWYQDGNLIPGATDYFYVAVQSGNYNIVATDINGCEVEAAIFDVVAALNQISFGSAGLAVFPNPVGDRLTFSIDGIFPENYPLRIYSVTGALVAEGYPASGSVAGFDVSGLAAGMYHLELNAGPKVYRGRFIKN